MCYGIFSLFESGQCKREHKKYYYAIINDERDSFRGSQYDLYELIQREVSRIITTYTITTL